MPKMFNIAGPCIPEEHYLVPTLARLPQLGGLIAAKQFFVIHAARQSGKTTLLKALARDLTRKDTYVALYCSLETAQGITEAERGIPAVINAVLNGLTWHPVFKNLAQPTVNLSAFRRLPVCVRSRHLEAGPRRDSARQSPLRGSHSADPFL